ncbi:TRAM domain-containing protein, partial [Acinetobacter pittii]
MDILKKNDEIELKIESLTSEGSGIAHYNNMAVFVSGVAPDDVVL